MNDEGNNMGTALQGCLVALFFGLLIMLALVFQMITEWLKH
jgi:hypothetical protein